MLDKPHAIGTEGFLERPLKGRRRRMPFPPIVPDGKLSDPIADNVTTMPLAKADSDRFFCDSPHQR
jgi:hypothetical protein